MKSLRRVTAGLAISLSLGAVTLLSLSAVHGQDATQEATPPAAPHWEYEGEEGPENWGDIDASFAACSTGHAQSPIDINSSIAQSVNLQDIKFDYQPSALNIFNNGHTIQVNYDAGSSITYNEIKYDLLQFHFHHPSEHTINGEAFDMELHFVHRDANGNLAVVGVLLNADEAENEAFTSIFDNLPTEKGTPTPTETQIDANTLLPESHLFDTYVGSLTTPPCSEGVRWLVLTTPVDLSAEQVESFASIFELDARPVQEIHDRDLLQDSTEN
jgi:carbonic anhydrase